LTRTSFRRRPRQLDGKSNTECGVQNAECGGRNAETQGNEPSWYSRELV
jgi:hypothetical protein